MHAIAKALQALPTGRFLLAISGGRDSMVLLHAFAAHRAADISAAATFDHGTGVAAAEAVELVVRECLRRGISVVAGRAPDGPSGRRTEAAWRAARWTFLRAVAEERRATIVTAHTLDDQAETVAIRILRDASARGLAGMAAATPGVVRPLLGVRRSVLADYARAEKVAYRDDPSNADRAYLRNRLRADLLAAIEARRPGFGDELAAIGRQAAEWRRDLAGLVDRLQPRDVDGAVVTDARTLRELTPDGLALVWPELAARAGVVLDRRGIQRLAPWTMAASAGQRMPLSGGAVVERTAATFVIRAPRRA